MSTPRETPARDENPSPSRLDGIWSATPTPLTDDLLVDVPSVRRMVEHHVDLGVQGLFLGGTCGEGPLLPRRQLRRLVYSTAQANEGRLVLSVQVTDNSAARVLDNIEDARADGADIAVLCEPWFDVPRATAAMKEKYYFATVEKSPLPVGIYFRRIYITLDRYRQLLLHPNVCMMKDSSLDDDLMQLCADLRRQRSDIAMLTGDEFAPGKYLRAGYSGILCGGGILTGRLLVAMLHAARQHDFTRVAAIQRRCDRILYTTYGGRTFPSWISGLKYLLQRMGIFSSASCYADYPLPDPVKRDIVALLAREHDVLLPSAVMTPELP